MRVTLTYTDNDSLTVEEIVAQATHSHGKGVHVHIMPESTHAHDLIYFGIQQIITNKQLSIWYDDKSMYEIEIQKLRSEILYKIEEILNQVVVDNEAKVT